MFCWRRKGSGGYGGVPVLNGLRARLVDVKRRVCRRVGHGETHGHLRARYQRKARKTDDLCRRGRRRGAFGVVSNGSRTVKIHAVNGAGGLELYGHVGAGSPSGRRRPRRPDAFRGDRVAAFRPVGVRMGRNDLREQLGACAFISKEPPKNSGQRHTTSYLLRTRMSRSVAMGIFQTMADDSVPGSPDSAYSCPAAQATPSR